MSFFTEKAPNNIQYLQKVYKVIEFFKTKFTIEYSMVKSYYIQNL